MSITWGLKTTDQNSSLNGVPYTKKSSNKTPKKGESFSMNENLNNKGEKNVATRLERKFNKN